MKYADKYYQIRMIYEKTGSIINTGKWGYIPQRGVTIVARGSQWRGLRVVEKPNDTFDVFVDFEKHDRQRDEQIQQRIKETRAQIQTLERNLVRLKEQLSCTIKKPPRAFVKRKKYVSP